MKQTKELFDSSEREKIQKERTDELNQLHLKKHLFGHLQGRPISWACDESRLSEGYNKIYLIDDDIAVHAMKTIDNQPIGSEDLRKSIQEYVKYFGGTYLKYGCLLVNRFGRPKLYDDEKEEQNGKEKNRSSLN